ncbi:unnamed protein product [Ectocarpus sp. 6 AP-2014]
MFKETEDVVLIVAGLSSAFAVGLSSLLIRRHLIHFSRPVVQGKIIGILWMVPIYAIDSFVSLRFKNTAPYVDMLRDCYEGYALYLFLALMVGYLGDGDEYKVVDILEQCPSSKHAWPFGLVLKGPMPHGRDFLRFAKFGTLQYSCVKPLAAFAALVLAPFGLFQEGDFSIYGGWLYISFVVNLSVCYAFYCLGMFYYVLKTPLKPFDPVPKFLCIKAVLFLSFWQGIVIAGLVKLNLIHEMGGWTTNNVEKGIQDLLVCVEMLVIAIAHTRAFSCKPYEDGAPRRDGASLLEAHFAHHSAIRDFNEVMPVLIPSSFRPGPARSSVRIPVGERGGVATWRASDGAVSSLFMPKERRSTDGGEQGEGGEGRETDRRLELEDLDSLRQSLLSAEDGEEDVRAEAGGEKEKLDDVSGDR